MIWLKDIVRTVRRTAGRFISIAVITAVGCGAFTGLKAAPEAMKTAAKEHIAQSQLMDLRLRSNIGVKSEQTAAVRSAEGVKGACAVYTKVLYCEDDSGTAPRNIVVKAFSLPGNIAPDSKNFLDRPQVIEGRLPNAANECAVELSLISPESFRTGGKITLSSPDPAGDLLEDTLAGDTFEIVGIVRSPIFPGAERDKTAVGDGTVNSNIYIPEAAFTCDYCTDLFVTLDLDSGLDPFSEEYSQAVKERGKAAEKAFEESVRERYEKLVSAAEARIERAREKTAAAEEILAADEEELEKLTEQARETAEKARERYGDSGSIIGQAAVAQAEKQLAALEELSADTDGSARERYAAELSAAREELSAAEEQLAEVPELAVYCEDRTANSDHASFAADTDRVAGLAEAFPPFLGLTGALICAAAMSRLTAGCRRETGIYCALGYGRGVLFGRFLLYGTAAALAGSLSGSVLGMAVIPKIISRVYGTLYNFPETGAVFRADLMFGAAAVSECIVGGAAFYAVRREMRVQTAELMRPLPPVSGGHILPEKLPLWGRLGFLGKLTVRNIFRYRKRALLTIIGAASCSALITSGFGLRDSIVSVIDKQFGEIYEYSAAVVLDTFKPDAAAALHEIEGIESALPAVMKSVSAGGDKRYSAYLIAAEGSFDGFIDLHGSSGEKLETTGGAVVTRKLAELCGIGAGESITVVTDSGETVSVPVTGTAENYALNYVYMDKTDYDVLFGGGTECNTAFVRFADGMDEIDIVKRLAVAPEVLGTELLTDTRKKFTDKADTLDSVVVVPLVCALLMAAAVLYDLTEINIAERRREIAAMKVLGFYESEAAGYILRELVILTAAGLPLGAILGKFVHERAVRAVEVDALALVHELSLRSYVLGAVITMSFTLIVCTAAAAVISRISMTESLGSVE